MKKAYRALTRMGDALVITVTAVVATLVLVATMVFDLVRLVAHPRTR